MQWDLFRSFEAVVRLGKITLAARALGVSQSTISRHIRRLEQEAGEPLFLRETPIVLTPRGEALFSALQPMVEAALAAQSALEDTPRLQGEVTLTTVGELVRWVLIKRVSLFYKRYPHLRLRVLADNHISSLAAGEADVALRWAKPTQGDLFVKKAYTEQFSFFASHRLVTTPETPWLGLSGSLSQIPEQRHMEKFFSSKPPRLLVEDLEALGEAVILGLGVAILPRVFASRLQGIVEVSPQELGLPASAAPSARSLWLVVHRSRQQLPKVRALISWLEQDVFAL